VDQITALKLIMMGGVALLIAGILIIAVFGTLEFVGPIYIFVGAVAMLFGALWVWKVDKVIKRRMAVARSRSAKRLMGLVLLTFFIIAPMFNVSHLQTCDTTGMCRAMRDRVLWVEYAVIGLLIISGFLAFGPIIFGRTILGPILAELQYIAGAMLVLLIFLFLLVVPIDVMFVYDPQQNCCYVRMDNLRTQGPILLRAILTLLSPPTMPS